MYQTWLKSKIPPRRKSKTVAMMANSTADDPSVRRPNPWPRSTAFLAILLMLNAIPGLKTHVAGLFLPALRLSARGKITGKAN